MPATAATDFEVSTGIVYAPILRETEEMYQDELDKLMTKGGATAQRVWEIVSQEKDFKTLTHPADKRMLIEELRASGEGSEVIEFLEEDLIREEARFAAYRAVSTHDLQYKGDVLPDSMNGAQSLEMMHARASGKHGAAKLAAATFAKRRTATTKSGRFIEEQIAELAAQLAEEVTTLPPLEAIIEGNNIAAAVHSAHGTRPAPLNRVSRIIEQMIPNAFLDEAMGKHGLEKVNGATKVMRAITSRDGSSICTASGKEDGVQLVRIGLEEHTKGKTGMARITAMKEVIDAAYFCRDELQPDLKLLIEADMADAMQGQKDVIATIEAAAPLLDALKDHKYSHLKKLAMQSVLPHLNGAVVAIRLQRLPAKEAFVELKRVYELAGKPCKKEDKDPITKEDKDPAKKMCDELESYNIQACRQIAEEIGVEDPIGAIEEMHKVGINPHSEWLESSCDGHPYSEYRRIISELAERGLADAKEFEGSERIKRLEILERCTPSRYEVVYNPIVIALRDAKSVAEQEQLKAKFAL